MSIKVTVDFTNGCYNVTGEFEGKSYQIQKPMIIIEKNNDSTFQSRHNYSRRIMSKYKRELSRVAKVLMKKYPKFKASEESLNKIDYLKYKVYKVLEDWDKMNRRRTKYSIDYLMAVVKKKLEMDSKPGVPIGVFEEESIDSDLKEAGIEIIYKGIPEDLEKIIVSETLRQYSNYDDQEKDEIEKDEHSEDYWLDFDGEDELIDKTAKKLSENIGKEINLVEKETKGDSSLDFASKDELKVKRRNFIDKNAIKPIMVSDEIRQQSIIVDGMVQKTKNVLNKMNRELIEHSEEIKQQQRVVDEVIQRNQDELNSKLEILKTETKEKLLNASSNGKNYSVENAKLVLEKMNKELQSFIQQSKKDDSESEKKDIDSKTVEQSKMERNNKFNLCEILKCKTWTRKLRDINDSIKNKKIDLNKTTLKGKVVKGFMALIAVASITATTYNVSKIVSNLEKEINPNSNYETEYTESDIDLVDESDEQILVQTVFNQNEVESEKSQIKEKAQETKAQETKAQETKAQETKAQETKAQETRAQETKKEEIKEGKIDKEKLEEFRQDAIMKYMEAFIIGEKPSVGNLLQEKPFFEKPDGGGKVGHFYKDLNFKVEHVEIITPEDWYIVKTNGRSLINVLSEYPNRIGYSIHFSNLETKGGLGFVTQSQLEEIINNKVNSIIENKQSAVLKQNNDEIQGR